MSEWTTMTVWGTPAPQGSKRHVGNGRMVESSKAVKPWRESIVWQCKGFAMTFGPVELDILFILHRPATASKKRTVPDRKPDIDKLIRSTLDGLKTARIYEDDARVVKVTVEKRYAAHEEITGAVIRIRKVEGR